MVIVEIAGQVVRLGSLFDQIYSLEDEKGWQYHWNVTEGFRRAQRRGGLVSFAPADHDITVEVIHATYVGLNEEYALRTNLSRPLLFVSLNGQMQLADGWHRLYKAVVTQEELLPAYVLTEAESRAILVMRLPPGKGIDLTGGDDQANGKKNPSKGRRKP